MNSQQTLITDPIIKRQSTALVVEDEHALRTALAAMLRSAGFRVLSCSCADDAIALLSEGERDISLLLTDILLPGINGHDLAQFVQAQVPSIHTIYMSGFSAGFLSASDLSSPHTTFLQKPFNRARLMAAISEVSFNSTNPLHS